VLPGKRGCNLGSQGHFFVVASYFFEGGFARDRHSRPAAAHSNQGSNPEHPQKGFKISNFGYQIGCEPIKEQEGHDGSYPGDCKGLGRHRISQLREPFFPLATQNPAAPILLQKFILFMVIDLQISKRVGTRAANSPATNHSLL
jgi:hypothetical protein